MSLKISALGAGFLIASLAVPLAAPAALAAGSDTPAATHRVHHARAAHPAYHRHYAARRYPAPLYDYDHPAPVPGYRFIPGKGIAGESCNMPTSTCSNDYRDTQ